jgi:hypothetical protein
VKWAEIGADDDGEDRVAAGGRVIGAEDDGIAGGGDLDGARDHGRGQGVVAVPAQQVRPFEPGPRPIADRGDDEGFFEERAQGLRGEPVEIRPRHDPDHRRAASRGVGECVGVGVRVCVGVRECIRVALLPPDLHPVPPLQPAPLEPPDPRDPQRPPSAQHSRHLHPASNRHVAHAKLASPLDPPGIALQERAHGPLLRGERHGPAARDHPHRPHELDPRRPAYVPDSLVRAREGLGDERSSGRNPLVHAPWAPSVLHHREPGDAHHLDRDHPATSNRTRSPSPSVAPRAESKGVKSTARAMRCHPPGEAKG